LRIIVKQFKQILLTAMSLCCIVSAIAQTRHPTIISKHKDFNQLLKEADLKLTFPIGFKEIEAVNDEDFSFDFAMELPGKDFEMWLQVKSQKQNWTSYEHAQYDKKTELANPDSMYIDMSRADAIALTDDDKFLVRNMPPEVLARYNADAGKSYLLNLTDLPVTKHYKYALLIALQKNHTGTLVAIYFTNDKDPDFYRDVYRAGRCLKFIQPTAN